MKFIIKLLTCLVATVAAEKVQLRLRNQNDDYLSVHWVNPDTQETAIITKLLKPWASSSITTFLSHNFQLRQEVNPDTGQCGNDDDKECKTFNFQITEYNEQGEQSEVCRDILCVSVASVASMLLFQTVKKALKHRTFSS